MSQNDIFRVTVHVGVSGRATTFAHYWRQTSTEPSFSNPTHLLVAWETFVREDLMDCLSTGAQVSQVTAHQMVTPGVPATSLYGDNTGNIPGPTLPPNKALVLSILQPDIEPKHNNRIYLPGTTEGSTDGNIFTQTFRDGPVTTFRDKLLSTIDDGDPGNGTYVLQAYTNQGPSPVETDFKSVSGIVIRPQVFSQRPRTSRNERILA